MTVLTIVDLLARRLDESTLTDMRLRLRDQLRMLHFELQQVDQAIAQLEARKRAAARQQRHGLEHGRAGTYNRGCRCDACRAAKTAYQSAYRSKRRNPA